MSNKSFKGWLITSGTFAGAGLICIIVKFVELSMRTEHAWAQSFLIAGLSLIGVALLILIGVIIAGAIIDKKNANKPVVSDEEILAKYKSKGNK